MEQFYTKCSPRRGLCLQKKGCKFKKICRHVLKDRQPVKKTADFKSLCIPNQIIINKFVLN